MRAALIVALALSAAPAAALAATHDPAACGRQIKRQTAHGRPAAEPACWRLGPIVLGMSAVEVAKLIGPPDYEAAGPAVTLPSHVDRTGYRDAFYVFPRDLARRLAREPAGRIDMRILEVSYFHDRAVRLDNADAVEIRNGPCKAATSDLLGKGEPADFAPFRSFAGVHEGDSVATLIERFGKPTTMNRPRDFYAYMPTPLTIEINIDHDAVGGFSIGVDTDAVFLGGRARLELTHDPATCQVTGLRFLPDRPEGR